MRLLSCFVDRTPIFCSKLQFSDILFHDLQVTIEYLVHSNQMPKITEVRFWHRRACSSTLCPTGKVTTQAPETTSAPEEVTTSAPASTSAPEVTTQAPATTSAPEVTTKQVFWHSFRQFSLLSAVYPYLSANQVVLGITLKDDGSSSMKGRSEAVE